MTNFKSALTAAALAIALGATGAMAASAANPASAASPATAAKPAKVAKVHSPESIECSKQADAKGLHGVERKSFRATCKSQLKSANPASAAKKPDANAGDKKS